MSGHAAMSREREGAIAALTRTMSGPRPSDEPATLSMYFFRSRSRNSKTR